MSAERLHDEIMNLRCVPPSDADEKSYRIGHRDARHAAAELALGDTGRATPAAPDVGRLRWECDAALSAAAFVERYARECCRHTEAVADCPHCNLNFLADWSRRAVAAVRAPSGEGRGSDATELAWPQDAAELVAMADEWPTPIADSGQMFSGDVLIKKLGNALKSLLAAAGGVPPEPPQ